MDNSLFYPVLDVLPEDETRGLLLGKNGNLTYVVRLLEPEVYSLFKNEIETRHSVFCQAFSHMPDRSYIHKQDIYRRMHYTPGRFESSSYLSHADMAHFSGREYFSHECLLAFTLTGLDSLSSAYEKNPFSFRKELIASDLSRLTDFLSAVQFAVNNLSSLPSLKVVFLSVDELKQHIFYSANFFDSAIQDINFSQEITAGDTHSRLYALTDEEFFVDESYPVFSKDFTVSREKSELYISPAEMFGGIHLHHNHIYNQILYFFSDRRLKEELRKNLDEHIVNRGWDKVNIPPRIKLLESLTQEITENREVLCFAHYSILLWDTDPSRLQAAEKDLRAALDVSNIKYYLPSYGNLAELYGGNVLGCAASLPIGYMFRTTLSFGVSFFVHYSSFENDPEGIYFNDRLTQIPLRKDIWDAKSRRIKARNAVVVAPTGGGKSFITNNIIQQLLDQQFTVVGVEFGNSFKQLCFLYPEISIHIEYDQSQPLGINPFNLGGNPLTPEKEDMLVTLCLRFWRNSSPDANLIVSLRKLINLYYSTVTFGHSFQGFYTFVTSDFDTLCERTKIKREYFDVDSFRHVCSEFMPGGTYANLCASTGVASDLSDKRFIHFELTKIKANPFVASVVMSLLFDVINNKILSDPSRRGYIIFDEYAETAQMKSSSSLDVDIHQTVAFFYQKIRKENGAVMTIIQSPVQLPDNEFTKGIIANTQLLYVLEGTEVVYDAIIDTFKIKNPAHINQMKSIQNNYTHARPYSECWIRFGENYALTVRLEASRRKYLAFQTQGEIRSALDRIYRENGGDMEAAIETYINN